MGFWGIEVKPGKPYLYRSDNGKLNITQATLGIGSSTERSIIQCSVGEKCPIFLCSLLPNKIECCPLNLEFEDDDSVAFSVIGPQSIHLSGIVVANGEDSAEDDYYLDSFGEDIAETETEESTDYDTEDEYEDDFIDDSDLEMYSQSPMPNSGVVIEEIVDDERPINGNEQSKQLKKKNKSSDSKDNKYSQHQIVVKNNTGVPVLESEDEDGFPISATKKSKLANQKPQSESEETDRKTTEKPKKKKEKDGGHKATSLKRKVESVDQDDQPKKQKKKKKQKEKGKVRKANEAGTDDNLSVHMADENQPEEVKNQTLNQDLPVGNERGQKLFNEKILDTDPDRIPGENYSEIKKKKKKNKKKAQASEAVSNTNQTVIDTGDKDMSTLGSEKKTEAKSSQVRTFANGLVIEELSMGKPDGKRASPGKKVSVHYIGKLKKNGKIFDSNVGRAPFKFLLGVGHVIKGWEVGVKGMRVGDKRRLTVPPSMGYGSKNVGGGTIPPNSWLVFDVELANVS